MQRDREAADIDDVFSLAADRLREGFEVGLAELLVLDELDVPVGVLLAWLFVNDDFDAGVLSALEDRLQRRAVVRDDADDIDFLGDQVFDRPDLLGGVSLGREDHRGVYAEFLTGLEHALFDVVEPRNANLADDSNLRRVVGSPSPERTEHRQCADSGAGLEDCSSCNWTHWLFLPCKRSSSMPTVPKWTDHFCTLCLAGKSSARRLRRLSASTMDQASTPVNVAATGRLSRAILFDDAARACLDVVQMKAHGGDGLDGIVRFDGADYRCVLAKASANERQVLGRPAADVETHVVETIGDPFEDHIAGGGREAGVKAAIENSEGHGIAQHLFMRHQHSVEIVDVVGRGFLCRLPNDLEFDDATAVEGVGQVRLRQGKKEIERREQCSRFEVGHIGAAAMARVDDPEYRKGAEGLAQAWPADVENLYQVALRREPVAGAEHARSDEVEDAIDDRLRNALLGAGLHIAPYRQERYVRLLCHVVPLRIRSF